MIPLKTFIFRDLDTENIIITILSYDFLTAYEKLVLITKNPANFKLINQQ